MLNWQSKQARAGEVILCFDGVSLHPGLCLANGTANNTKGKGRREERKRGNGERLEEIGRWRGDRGEEERKRGSDGVAKGGEWEV